MTVEIAAQPMPLRTDADGVIRVGRTRVTLDSIVEAFDEGATAEEIAYRYPAVELSDIYAAITYLLKNRPVVDAYLAERSARASEVRRENEARSPTAGLRERLLARRAASGAAGGTCSGSSPTRTSTTGS